MSLELLKASKARAVGTKQTTKAVERGLARIVFVAKDAEEYIVNPLLSLCKDRNVEVAWADRMRDLGKACGIKVGTASVAVLED